MQLSANISYQSIRKLSFKMNKWSYSYVCETEHGPIILHNDIRSETTDSVWGVLHIYFIKE